MKMRSVYRWASGLCAAAAVALALDASCVEDKYTPPKDTRNDIEVVVDVLDPTKNKVFLLTDGRFPQLTYNPSDKTIFFMDIDTRLKDIKTILKKDSGYFECERVKVYPSENRFEPATPLKDSPAGPIPLTEQEVEEVKAEYRKVFSDIAKSLRRNVEIETRLRADTLRTGKVVKSHKEPAFNYSWMPSWMHTLFSRTVIDDAEKEYDMGSEKIKVEVSTNSRSYLKITLNEALGLHSDTLMDVEGDGYFEIIPGYEETRDILDRLAPLVGMEDEK